MAKIDRVQEVSIDLLVPYKRNAKVHDKSQVEKIAESIKSFGFLNPCLIDEKYNVIAGHGRLMAAGLLGMKTIPCIYIEGLTESERRAYILADNRLAELASWDNELVADELKDLQADDFDINLTGFSIDYAFLDKEPVDDLNTWKEVENSMILEQRSKAGQVWVLGEHRLMIGDSTKPEDVRILMGGVKADLLETDPPYNVAVSNASGDTIINDNMDDLAFERFLFSAFSNASNALKAGGSFYIWHADYNGKVFRNTAEKAGLKIRQNLIWVKNHFTLGRQDYQWMHEPCLYGWKDGAKHYFQEARNIPSVIYSLDLNSATKEDLIDLIQDIKDNSTIMNENRPMVDDLHPTMKPISLITKQIKNSSREGEIVLDLFGGSGTTLIACENIKRKCYMMEYDPRYADVIIDRWEKLTGKTAELERSLNG